MVLASHDHGVAVDDEHLLTGLEEGQSIDVTIEEQDSGIYVITAVTLAGATGGSIPKNDAAAGHDEHGSEPGQ